MSGQNILQASSINPQTLVSTRLSVTEAALYTVASFTSAKLATGSLCNITTSPVTVYLSIVQNGGTLGDGTHRIVSGYSLAANDTLPLNDYIGGAMLGPGDAIAAYASAATAVDLVVTGTVHS